MLNLLFITTATPHHLPTSIIIRRVPPWVYEVESCLIKAQTRSHLTSMFNGRGLEANLVFGMEFELLVVVVLGRMIIYHSMSSPSYPLPLILLPLDVCCKLLRELYSVELTRLVDYSQTLKYHVPNASNPL